MSKKAVLPLLTGVTIALLALPVVGSLRAGKSQAQPTAPVTCDGYVALTFDDGPTANTPALLKILAERGVRATLFNVGEAVETHPEMVQVELDGGHTVENHTNTHPHLTTLSPGQIASEITRANDALRAAGAEPSWLRPPYGEVDERVEAAAAAAGLQHVIWTTDTFDWKPSTTREIVNRALAVKPGGIILMHDGAQQTLDALPAILDGLAERGLCPGQIVPDSAEHAPDGWADNTYRATAGPWSTPSPEL
jgi:peptidoglycan-N-acetylglucosamine deacetylase